MATTAQWGLVSGKIAFIQPILFPGVKAIDQALRAASGILGNTIHFIDEGIDTGEMIAQTSMKTEDFTSYEDVLELQFPLIKYALQRVYGILCIFSRVCWRFNT